MIIYIYITSDSLWMYTQWLDGRIGINKNLAYLFCITQDLMVMLKMPTQPLHIQKINHDAKKEQKSKTHFYYVTNTLNAKWKTTSCLQHQWYPNLPFTHIILLMKFYLLIDWSETTKFSHGNGGNEHCCNNNNNKANEKIMNVHVSCAAPKGHCFCRWSLIGIYWFDLSIPHLVFTITLPPAQLLYMENQMYHFTALLLPSHQKQMM